jgi:hypothetical protein
MPCHAISGPSPYTLSSAESLCVLRLPRVFHVELDYYHGAEGVHQNTGIFPVVRQPNLLPPCSTHSSGLDDELETPSKYQFMTIMILSFFMAHLAGDYRWTRQELSMNNTAAPDHV